MKKLVKIIMIISLILSCDNSKTLVNTDGKNISIDREIEPVKRG
jgi:hypothetical protein